MIVKPFDEINAKDIEGLKTEVVKENRSLEYKEVLPSSKDRDKVDFVSDVSAFANTNGGDIIFGIREKRIDNNPSGIPEEIKGVNVANEDTEIGRLLNVLSTGLDPRIDGIRIKFVHGFAAPVLIMRIPSSWKKPHMIILDTTRPRFYIRTEYGKHGLDVHEIRSAFALSESMGERLRKFRDVRLATLLADEGPGRIDSVPFVIVHIVPAGALDQRTRIDLTMDELRNIVPFTVGGWNPRFNFDGRLTPYIDREGITTAYAQIFRSGTIELFDSNCLTPRTENEYFIAAPYFEKHFLSHLPIYLQTLTRAGLTYPFFVMITFARVKGYKVPTGGQYPWVVYPIEKEFLFLPDVIIDSVEQNLPELFKETFYSLWQACGVRQSFSYDDKGNWAPHP